MPPILDLVIGIIFTFLLFSLVISALNELLLAMLDKRADFFVEGLSELLADSNTEGLLGKFLDHGLVDSLSRKTNGKPAYVPSSVFVSALLDLLSKANVNGVRTINDIKSGISKLQNPKLEASLTAILDEAGHDLVKFKQGLEVWFNQGMTRVSGWYKRYAQQWMFGLGLLLSIACNIDTIHIIQALSSNRTLREAVVRQAIDYAKTKPRPVKGSPQVNTNALATTTTNEMMQNVQKVESSLAKMNATGLPLGWGDTQLAYFKDDNSHWIASRILMAFFGCLLTALAGSLGAPFWFDTLNRIINIRNNGRAPEEGDPTNPTPRS